MPLRASRAPRQLTPAAIRRLIRFFSKCRHLAAAIAGKGRTELAESNAADHARRKGTKKRSNLIAENAYQSYHPQFAIQRTTGEHLVHTTIAGRI